MQTCSVSTFKYWRYVLRWKYWKLYVGIPYSLYTVSSISFLNKEHLHVHIYYRSSVLEKEYLHILNCISNLEKQWYERVKCGLLIRIKYIWISTITLLAKQNDSQRLGCNDCPIYEKIQKMENWLIFTFIIVLDNIFVMF